MKLTEKQLAQLFIQSKDTIIDHPTDALNMGSDASDTRIKSVEKIANNSTLSASYHIINQLPEWSNNLSKGFKPTETQDYFSLIMNWFKPALATAAMVTAVYFITPQMNNKVHTLNVPKVASTTTPLFNGNFEKNVNQPAPQIRSKASDSDVIYSGGFG